MNTFVDIWKIDLYHCRCPWNANRKKEITDITTTFLLIILKTWTLTVNKLKPDRHKYNKYRWRWQTCQPIYSTSCWSCSLFFTTSGKDSRVCVDKTRVTSDIHTCSIYRIRRLGDGTGAALTSLILMIMLLNILSSFSLFCWLVWWMICCWRRHDIMNILDDALTDMTA